MAYNEWFMARLLFRKQFALFNVREFHNAINWNINEIKESICIYTFFLLNGPNIKYKFQISLTFAFGCFACTSGNIAIFNVCNFTCGCVFLWVTFHTLLCFPQRMISFQRSNKATKKSSNVFQLYSIGARLFERELYSI